MLDDDKEITRGGGPLEPECMALIRIDWVEAKYPNQINFPDRQISELWVLPLIGQSLPGNQKLTSENLPWRLSPVRVLDKTEKLKRNPKSIQKTPSDLKLTTTGKGSPFQIPEDYCEYTPRAKKSVTVLVVASNGSPALNSYCHFDWNVVKNMMGKRNTVLYPSQFRAVLSIFLEFTTSSHYNL